MVTSCVPPGAELSELSAGRAQQPRRLGKMRAQIAALAQLGAKGDPGGVDIVFTEDSDLVAYGCPLVLFKLDKFGEAQELLLEDVMAGPPAEAAAGVNGAARARVPSSPSFTPPTKPRIRA